MLGNRLVTFTIGTVLMAMAALAQEDEGRSKNEVSVQALGSFVQQTTQSGVQHDATDSSGVVATYRYYFNRHNGIEATYAWAPNTETYNQVGVDNNSHEISAAYVFRLPMRRWSPFVLAGASALIFDPKNFAGASTQTRAGFVYGAGADFNLTHRLFVRAEYRGFVYNSPTYDLVNLNGLDRVTHRAEPSIGFGWRF